MSITVPTSLIEALTAEIGTFDGTALRNAAQKLSLGYRRAYAIEATLSPTERAAYLAVRFPSTFSAVLKAIDHWREHQTIRPKSLLDVGAGPGTGTLAAACRWPDLTPTLLERDAGWQHVALRLSRSLQLQPQFVRDAVEHMPQLGQFDVVIASYCLNEISNAEAILEWLWSRTGQALILVEPGTPLGFSVVRGLRQRLIDLGATIAAPCTHHLICPMSEKDWCHSAVRVQRMTSHRAAKDASLGYEDEKFSYVIATRSPRASRTDGRIVRRPIMAKGHVHLDLCREGLIERRTLSRRQGDDYKQARKADWGDLWPVD